MKTTKSRKSKKNRSQDKTAHFRKESDALAVLRDVSNGREFYLSVIDSFPFRGRDYVVMYNYEPDDGNHSEPELVVMRSEFSEIGNQCFYSITEKSELNAVFARFVDRFVGSTAKSGGKT